MTSRCHTLRTSSSLRIPPMRGALIVALATPLPPSEWEKIEDIVAHALHLAGYRGNVFDSVTGNTTAIRDLSGVSSAVKQVRWHRERAALQRRESRFCPECGDTLFCNHCGKEAR